jgi:hypothetical protein
VNAELRIVILYEDQRGPTRELGLHKLVEACVFDLVDGQRHLLARALDGRQSNGDAKLLRVCRQDVGDISPKGHPVVALFDNDRVRRLLGLSHQAERATVIAKIKEDCCAPAQLTVFLLEEKMESVVEAAGQCDPSTARHFLAEALRKNLAARDIVLKEACRGDKQAVRACILGKVPSLRPLIEQCARWLLALDATGGRA